MFKLNCMPVLTSSLSIPVDNLGLSNEPELDLITFLTSVISAVIFSTSCFSITLNSDIVIRELGESGHTSSKSLFLVSATGLR